MAQCFDLGIKKFKLGAQDSLTSLEHNTRVPTGLVLGPPDAVFNALSTRLPPSCLCNEVTRAVTKGRGPGISPSYYQSEPRLLVL